MTGLSHPLGMYFLFVGTQLLQGDDPGQLWVLYVFREETLTGQERRPEAALTWSAMAGGCPYLVSCGWWWQSWRVGDHAQRGLQLLGRQKEVGHHNRFRAATAVKGQKC